MSKKFQLGLRASPSGLVAVAMAEDLVEAVAESHRTASELVISVETRGLSEVEEEEAEEVEAAEVLAETMGPLTEEDLPVSVEEVAEDITSATVVTTTALGRCSLGSAVSYLSTLNRPFLIPTRVADIYGRSLNSQMYFASSLLIPIQPSPSSPF